MNPNAAIEWIMKYGEAMYFDINTCRHVAEFVIPPAMTLWATLSDSEKLVVIGLQGRIKKHIGN